MTTKRILYFDNLKFILILCVVIGHFVEGSVSTSDYAKAIWLFLYTFHIPLFVFVAGFMAKSAIKNSNKNRLISFFILYILLHFLLYLFNLFSSVKIISFKILETSSAEWYLLAMDIWLIISYITKRMNKKYLLLISIMISLIIGYDESIGDFLILSRIIVFYPFFLAGIMLDKDIIFKRFKNKYVVIFSFILLISVALFFFKNIDNIYWIRPLLTGRNPYIVLQNYGIDEMLVKFGFILRILYYLFVTLLSIMIMAITPKCNLFITKLGNRTIAVYFFHKFVIIVLTYFNLHFRVSLLIILAIITTFILSLKVFYLPFEKLFNIKFIASKENMKTD